MILLLGGLWLGWNVSGAGNRLPECTAPETTALVRSVVEGLEPMKAANAQFGALDGIREATYDPKTQVRQCTAGLTTTLGRNQIEYAIQWQDRGKALFTVQLNVR